MDTIATIIIIIIIIIVMTVVKTFMYAIQRAKKVVSDSLGLVDFVIGLVDSDHHLRDGQVKFFGN